MRQRLAQGQRLRAIDTGQAGFGGAQRQYRRRHIARQLQLLTGQHDRLLGLEQPGIVTTAREVLIERLQRFRLRLEFGQPRIGGTQLALQAFDLLAHLLQGAAIFLAAGIGLGQTTRNLFLHVG